MKNIFERSVWIGTNAERTAFTPTLAGTVFFESDTGSSFWWDGAIWKSMGGGGGGHTIQEEGVGLTQRTNLNFVGFGVTATDGGAGPNSTIVTIPGGVDNLKEIVFNIPGTIYVSTGGLRLANTFGANFNIEEVEIMVGTAPTGSGITVDIHKNGVTIFTNQAHRPTIAAGAYQGTTTTIDVPAWNDGNYLTMDIDGIGSTTAGGNLTCMIRARSA